MFERAEAPDFDPGGAGREPACTISVLIPTYNRAAQLGATLESIARQTRSVDEIVVVDDGSTDETQRVVFEVLDREGWNGELQYLRQANQGKSVALNQALRIAKGRWIAFNDSDDLWTDDKIERQMAALIERPGYTVCFSSVRYVNNARMKGTSFDGARYRYSAPSGSIQDPARLILDAPHGVYMQTVLVRADTMRQVGEFNPRYRVSQDTDFLFRLGLAARWCYVNAPLVLLDRTEDRTSGLTTTHTRRDHYRLEVLESMYGGWLQLANDGRRDLSPDIRRRLQGVRFERVNVDLDAGAWREARRRSWTALRARWSAKAAARLLAVTVAPRWSERRVRKDASSTS